MKRLFAITINPQPKRHLFTTECWICHKPIIHNRIYHNMCRITHQTCAKFNSKKRNINYGRMNDQILYRIQHSGRLCVYTKK